MVRKVFHLPVTSQSCLESAVQLGHVTAGLEVVDDVSNPQPQPERRRRLLPHHRRIEPEGELLGRCDAGRRNLTAQNPRRSSTDSFKVTHHRDMVGS